MGHYNSDPSLLKVIQDLKKRIQALENTQSFGTYTTASRPPSANVAGGTIIYVSDATSGSRFQGWDSTAGAWVSLG